MTRVLEINNLERLGDHRHHWDRLLGVTPGASFFQSLIWLETYWQHYGRRQRMRVLVVTDGRETIGILPLVVRREKTRLGLMRVLTYPLHDWGTYYGPLGAKTSETLAAGLEHIRNTDRDWDLLDLRWVNKTADAGQTPEGLNAADLPAREQPWMSCAKIDTSGGWDAYWAGRTSHWRTNVRRCEKKLASLGGVTYLRYRPAGAAHGQDDPRWELYEACEEIARHSWQADSTTGTTLTHDEVRAFLRDTHAAAAHFGALDLNLLLLDQRPVAFNYAYHYRGYLFGLRMGFNAAVSSDGSGTVLQHRMIQDSFARGDHTYDLGAGYLDCKRFWPTHIECSYRYTHYPVRPRAQMLRAKRFLSLWWEKSWPAGIDTKAQIARSAV